MTKKNNAKMLFISNIAITSGFAILALLFISASYAADIKPCTSCALQRLVAPAVRDLGYDNYDSMESALVIDYATLEKVVPSSNPKTLTGFSPEEQAALTFFFARETVFRPDEVVASYETGGRKVSITYSDLERSISEQPFYKDNTSSIVLVAKPQKLNYLNNIIKTNLLYEEGMADLKKYEKFIMSVDDYHKTSVYKAAYSKILDGIIAGVSQNPSVQAAPIDIESAARGKMIGEIGFSVKTESVVLLKKIKTFKKYDGDLQTKLAVFKNGAFTIGDLKKYADKDTSMWDFFTGVPDAFFIDNLVNNLMLPDSYYRYLVAENKIDIKNHDYDEYVVYTLSSLVLNELNAGVKVSEKECEQYLKKNPEAFKAREGIILSYFIFKKGEAEFFKKLAAESFKSSTAIFEKILSKNIVCENSDGKKFYRGQLDAGIEDYLYGLKKGDFSKIIPLSGAGDKFALFYVSEKIPAAALDFKKLYPIIHRQLLAEKQALEIENYFKGLYEKHGVKIYIK